MTILNAFKRSVATFVAGAVASPIASLVFDVGYWKVAAIAGLTAVVNLAGRAAQTWLTKHPES